MSQAFGLHQRDNEMLNKSILEMRDLGNTLIVVEHDEDTMYAADQVIDIGPGPGVHGGNVIAQRYSRRNKKSFRINYWRIFKWQKENSCT